MKNKIHFLESLRGVAAIYVLIHHCRWLLAENYSLRKFSSIDFNYIITKILVLFRFGHEAVIFFFILSGFVIHYSSINNKAYLNIPIYLKKRANRILPPLLFALILTFTLDYFGKNILHLNVYHVGSKYYGLIVDNLDLKSFLGNVVSLQELNTGIKHFGSNAALWSLSYEWWFYLLYPAFFFLNNKNKTISFILIFSLFIATQFFLPFVIPIITPIFSKMLIWWFGVIIADLYMNNNRILPYLSILSLGIPLAIVFFYNDRTIGDVFWGLGFSGLMALLLSLNPKNLLITTFNKISSIGKFSFTLYLIHVPIIFLAYAGLIDYYQGKLPNTYLYVLAISALCIWLAKFISSKIEKIRIFNTK